MYNFISQNVKYQGKTSFAVFIIYIHFEIKKQGNIFFMILKYAIEIKIK